MLSIKANPLSICRPINSSKISFISFSEPIFLNSIKTSLVILQTLTKNSLILFLASIKSEYRLERTGFIKSDTGLFKILFFSFLVFFSFLESLICSVCSSTCLI